MKRTPESLQKAISHLWKNRIFYFSLLLFFGLTVVFSIFAAGPLGSDELLYADTGLRGYGNYIVMNRYTHTYLQLLFMRLAPTPLQGMRIFWGFTMSLCSICVFLLSRFFRKENNFLHGFLALLLFFSLNLFNRYFGIVIVDLTTMMFVMVYLIILFLYIRRGFLKWLVLVLGFIFFLTIKSKELGIILFLTLPIYGYDKNGHFSIKNFAKTGLVFFAGVGLGVLLFVLLNSIILDDPLFGIRLSDWLAQRTTMESFTAVNAQPERFLQEHIFPKYFLPFTLYLFSANKNKSNGKNMTIYIWVIPLVHLIMLTVLMFKSGWRVEERFLFPVIALISVLAIQFFDFCLPKNKKEVIHTIIYLSISLLGFLVLRQLLFMITDYYEISYSAVILHYGVDIFFLVLVIAMVVIVQKNYLKSLLFIVLILINLYVPISTNLKLIIRRERQAIVNERFLPISLFANQVKLCSSSKVKISPLSLGYMGIHPDVYEAAGMFNIYFDESLPLEAFKFFVPEKLLSQNIIDTQVDYIYLQTEEWWDLSIDEQDAILDKYQIFEKNESNFLLLDSVNPNPCDK